MVDSSSSAKKAGRPVSPDIRSRREEEILDAAIRLFAEHGYNDTATQLLADVLQVGKGTIYRYFPTKRELFLAAIGRIMRQLKAAIDARIADVHEPLELLRLAAVEYLTFFRLNPAFVELLLQERALFKDRPKPVYFEFREANVERWRTVFRQLIADGRVRPIPVEQITSVLGDLIYGAMFTNYFTRRDLEPAEQARQLIDVAMRGVLSDAERKRQQEAAETGDTTCDLHTKG